MKVYQSLLCFFLLSESATAFSVVPKVTGRSAGTTTTTPAAETTRLSPLFMGRAAAVRASTKAKTDLKKAKTNALYGKKLIMAVKEGGSPDPNANRKLFDLIKQAKANSVPMDNINRASEYIYKVIEMRKSEIVKYWLLWLVSLKKSGA